jgi:8-oxo-dGTP pyrophosphatase MutT (NUDIX family)
MRWKVLKSSEVFKAGFFRLRVDECRLPDGRVMPRYYVMEFFDWVNVVPITADGQIVLVEQYRHGAGEVFLEIPGGGLQTADEDPGQAGRRELMEETGYASEEWLACGYHSPNPALQNNKMFTYLALNCRPAGAPMLDPFEDLQVRLMPLREFFERWWRGEIRHSLIAASFALALPELKARGIISF